MISHRAGAFLAVALIVGSAASPALAGYNITIPNGDFSSTTNVGTLGGQLLGGSGSGTFGAGPWGGTYTSALGLLLQPTLQIASGGPGLATISGIANIGTFVSPLDTTAYFSQSLTGVSYTANTTYTLSAIVSTGGLLSASILSDAGAGIALTSNGVPLTGSTSPLISVSLLSGTSYMVQATYTTTTAPSGSIGILLYDAPQGLLSSSVLSGVSFTSVSLTSSVPEPSSVAMTGMGLGLAVAGGIRRNRKKRLQSA